MEIKASSGEKKKDLLFLQNCAIPYIFLMFLYISKLPRSEPVIPILSLYRIARPRTILQYGGSTIVDRQRLHNNQEQC